MAATGDTIEVLNVGQPGKTYRVNGEKFNAMKKAVLAVLPDSEPGMKVPDAIEATKIHLPEVFVSRRRKGRCGSNPSSSSGGARHHRARRQSPGPSVEDNRKSLRQGTQPKNKTGEISWLTLTDSSSRFRPPTSRSSSTMPTWATACSWSWALPASWNAGRRCAGRKGNGLSRVGESQRGRDGGLFLDRMAGQGHAGCRLWPHG